MAFICSISPHFHHDAVVHGEEDFHLSETLIRRKGAVTIDRPVLLVLFGEYEDILFVHSSA